MKMIEDSKVEGYMWMARLSSFLHVFMGVPCVNFSFNIENKSLVIRRVRCLFQIW